MNWTLLQNSLLVSASATVLATLLGVLAALALSSLERRGRNCALALAITALALPPFLVTNCWLHYFGAAGTWRFWLPFNLFSLGGATWLLALQLWPVSALAAWAAWQTVEPPLLEADPAARGWAMIRWLLLPLAGKALGFAALLTFVLALNNFAVPAILQVKVLPAEVWVQFSTNLDPLAALRVGWPLVLAPLLVLPWLARQDVPWPRLSGPASAHIFRRQLGGGWFAMSLGIIVVLLAFSVLLPAVQLAGSARTWTELPAAVEAGQGATWHSFWFATISATAVVAIGLALAIVLQGRTSRPSGAGVPPVTVPTVVPAVASSANRDGWPDAGSRDGLPHCDVAAQASPPDFGFRASDFLRTSDFGLRTFFCWLPFFVPGVLLGIALIAFFNRPATFWLYRGAGIVLVALVVRYFALGWNGAALALRQSDPDLADAGRLDGATRWQLFRHIFWPQIAPQVAVTWYVVYLLCLWDVESVVLIIPPGGETLALRIFNLLHYGHNAQVNALCLTLLALALAPLLAGAVILKTGRLLVARVTGQLLPSVAAVGALALARMVLTPRIRAPASSRLSVVHGHRRGRLAPAVAVQGLKPAGSQRSGLSAFRGGCETAGLVAAIFLAGCGRTEPTNEAPLSSSLFAKAIVIGTRGVGVGQFNKPRSVAVDTNDNVYAADMTGRVQKFTPDGRYVLAWQLPQTDLGKPKGMTRDRAGRIVVIEPHYQRVNYFTPEGRLVAQWGVSGTNAGQLKMPRAAAVNSRGEICVAEYGVVERVQRFAVKGNNLSSLTNSESTLTLALSPSDGERVAVGRVRGSLEPAKELALASVEVEFLGGFGHYGTGPGEFNRPEGVAVDAQDRIYVADSCNHRIQVFDREGQFLRAFGRPGSGRGELGYPYDVCVDAAGRVYVCEFGNSRIQVFDANGTSLEIIGGPGAEPGQFNNPWGLALDSHENLYVADALNNRLQKLVRRAAAVAAGEVRSPKSEVRRNSEARNPQAHSGAGAPPAAVPTAVSAVGPSANRAGWPDAGSRDGLPHYPGSGLRTSDFGFRISFGPRISDFGFFSLLAFSS